MKKLTQHNLSCPVVVAVLVFILTLVTVATLVWRLETYRLVEARARVSGLTVDHAVALQLHIERAFSATYALAALVRGSNGAVRDFNKVASEMLPFYPGVAALELVPDGVVKSIVPLAGNEGAIGHDLLKDPVRNKEAFLARDTGRLTLAGPFNLLQGGLGAVARMPVFLDTPGGEKKFWGFTAVLIHFPETLAPANLSQLTSDGLAYELWRINPDTKLKQTIAASSSLPLADPVQQSLELPNGIWTLSVAPVSGWANPAGVWGKGILGLLFSLLLAWFAKLLVESKKQKQILEGLVAERTAEHKESEERLRLVGDNLPNSYIYQYIHDDSDPHFIQVSAGVDRVHGVSSRDVLQDANVLIRQVDPEQLPLLWAKENASKESMSDFCIRLRILRPDGEWRWLQMRSHPRKRPDGKVFWDGVATDITEEKKAEEELESARNEAVREKSYLEVVMEVLPVGVAIRDTNGDYIRANPTFTQAWAGPEMTEELKICPVYKAWLLETDQQLQPEEWASARALTKNEKVVGQLLKIERFDGSQAYIHNSAAPFHDSLGRVAGCAVAVMDISEQIQARDSLRQAKEAAEAANLAKSQFLANMSHELRTPMTSILGMIQLSLEEDIPPTAREYLETTLASAGSLLRILNDILDMTNIVGGRLSIIAEPFLLGTCVSDAINIIAPEARSKELAVIVSTADDVPDRVVSDQVRIRQILVNLVGNAVKFTRQGKVEVKLTRGGVGMDKQEINFSVSDTGRGIPEEKQQLLFQAFSQVEASHSRSFGGVGLGLFISKEIVKLMGGSISFESHEGMGSTFSFTIPVALDVSPGEAIPVAADSVVIPSTSPASRRMPHLLLAEDDPSIRQLLAQILRRSNFDLDVAEDGVEAVEKWEKGDYDLVLMDVQMPRADGFEATHAIREKEQERGGHTAIIAVTAHAQKEDVSKCLAAGMDAYISKPIDFKKTVALIHETLRKTDYESGGRRRSLQNFG